jgi:hypothetical protein
MGRPGIAMTFVTGRELRALKPLFKVNRIDPVWHGNIPDLQAVSKQSKRRAGKKYFKKRSRQYAKVNPPTARPEGLRVEDMSSRSLPQGSGSKTHAEA